MQIHRAVSDDGTAVAFVDSIGGPVHVAGWSYGAPRTLAAAANSDAVTAVALYEPTIVPVMSEDDLADAVELVTTHPRRRSAGLHGGSGGSKL